nr:hypothetical protein [Vibrio navarrensis]
MHPLTQRYKYWRLDRLEKVVIGVLVGFIVNRAYDWVSNMWCRTKIGSSLVEELTLAHDDILFVREIIKKKISGSEGVGVGSYPRKINYPIYEKYYADVCLSLNNSQRSSFQQIYTGIAELNMFIVELYTERLNEDYCNSNATRLRLAESYSTANDMLFFIKNHVEHPKFPLIGEQLNAELKLVREKTDRYLRQYGFEFN